MIQDKKSQTSNVSGTTTADGRVLDLTVFDMLQQLLCSSHDALRTQKIDLKVWIGRRPNQNDT
jgi:hypothetical protein